MNALFTDCYELTMANALFLEGKQNEVSQFDLFFRRIPEDGGYAVFAGLESIIDYIQKLKFTNDDIKYLKENFYTLF